MSVIITLEIVAASHLLLFGFYTLLNNKSRNMGVRLIGLFLSLLGIHFTILSFVPIWDYYNLKNLLLSLFLVSYGPLLYITNKNYLNDYGKLKREDFYHLISIPIYVVLFIAFNSTFIEWSTQPLSIEQILIFAHICFYIGLSIRVTIKNENIADAKLKLKILRFINLTFMILIGIWIVFLVNEIIPLISRYALAIGFISWLIVMVDGLIIYFFRYPDLYVKSNYLRTRSSEWVSEKYSYSELNESYIDSILNQLHKLIEEQESYKDSDLTLAKVSLELGFPSRDISQAINCQLNKTFREYLNEVRIQKAGRIIEEKQNPRVNEVMYDVGFSSKSIFHKYFKEAYGKTPKQYIREAAVTA